MLSRFVRGRLSEALALAEEGIALGAENPTLGSEFRALRCPYAWSLYMKGLLLCFMGHLNESARELDCALRVAHEQEDLEVQGWTHMGHVWLARFTGQTKTVLAHATQADEIAERTGSACSRAMSLGALGGAHLMLGETDDATAALDRSITLARETRTALEHEAWHMAWLSEALLSAGDQVTALEMAEESVALALQRGTEAILPTCYRVLAEAVLASDRPGKIASAQEALENATAAVQVTGAHAELPFIERTRKMACR